MTRNVAGGDAPFQDTGLGVAIERSAGGVVLGVGDVDVPIGRVYGDSVRSHDLAFGSVSDELARDDILVGDVDDGVRNCAAVSLIAELAAVSVELVAGDGHVRHRNIHCFGYGVFPALVLKPVEVR